MADVRTRGLARLMLRWPGKRADLARKFREDARFGELCEAYEAACTAVDYWSRSDAAVAPARMAEYRALVSATEEDIFARIC